MHDFAFSPVSFGTQRTYTTTLTPPPLSPSPSVPTCGRLVPCSTPPPKLLMPLPPRLGRRRGRGLGLGHELDCLVDGGDCAQAGCCGSID
jgi:hypothetical protein